MFELQVFMTSIKRNKYYTRNLDNILSIPNLKTIKPKYAVDYIMNQFISEI